MQLTCVWWGGRENGWRSRPTQSGCDWWAVSWPRRPIGATRPTGGTSTRSLSPVLRKSHVNCFSTDNNRIIKEHSALETSVENKPSIKGTADQTKFQHLNSSETQMKRNPKSAGQTFRVEGTKDKKNWFHVCFHRIDRGWCGYGTCLVCTSSRYSSCSSRLLLKRASRLDESTTGGGGGVSGVEVVGFGRRAFVLLPSHADRNGYMALRSTFSIKSWSLDECTANFEAMANEVSFNNN